MSKPSSTVRRWREANPEKWYAHQQVQLAVRRGDLSPEPCFYCDAESHRQHAHHSDYSCVLDVTWLCPSCHAKVTFGKLPEPPLVLRSVPIGLPERLDDPAEKLAHHERLSRVRAALASLGPEDREILRMVAEGYTQAEIAACLGITTAQYHSASARNKFVTAYSLLGGMS